MFEFKIRMVSIWIKFNINENAHAFPYLFAIRNSQFTFPKHCLPYRLSFIVSIRQKLAKFEFSSFMFYLYICYLFSCRFGYVFIKFTFCFYFGVPSIYNLRFSIRLFWNLGTLFCLMFIFHLPKNPVKCIFNLLQLKIPWHIPSDC